MGFTGRVMLPAGAGNAPLGYYRHGPVRDSAGYVHFKVNSILPADDNRVYYGEYSHIILNTLVSTAGRHDLYDIGHFFMKVGGK